MNIKTIGTVALMAAMVTGTAAHAYTITITDPLTPVTNTQFDGFETNQNVNNGFTFTSFVTQGNTWDLINSAVIPGPDRKTSYYDSPDGHNTYIASSGGVVAHLGQEYTGISFEWGTPSSGPSTINPSSDVLVLGNTIITSPSIYQLSDPTQPAAFVTITGLAPFDIAEFNTMYVYDNQPHPAYSFEFADVSFSGGTATPELSTWAMMLVGFFGLGYAAMRKGKAAAA